MSATRKYYIICEVSEIEVTQEQFNNYIEDLKRHQETIGQKVWYETDDSEPDQCLWFYQSGALNCFIGYSLLV